MTTSIFATLGEQLRAFRHARALSQPELAERLGRNRARISELERDLIGERWGRDRLTLFADICDALDIVPILVPRAQALEIRQRIDVARAINFHEPVRSAFEELFVDLDAEDEEKETP
ncbi:helix-turn-helix domain-containing protein [Sphingomonas xinjiangensis]|uniref:Transcriptional regulator with XRE-family HTH domain n=1 Tax=Sphingomonas xinjiangensis TaxID=643568 RepID=A0A840YSE2_9SPHN|nr:helix-turn-helix transcriptional regulator [Sphingomonas xinjiangensis]MBB5712595.1 transcriptional regulator with XRE-family HTH domain [Sphingomonas xinjiangensis]